MVRRKGLWQKLPQASSWVHTSYTSLGRLKGCATLQGPTCCKTLSLHCCRLPGSQMRLQTLQQQPQPVRLLIRQRGLSCKQHSRAASPTCCMLAEVHQRSQELVPPSGNPSR